MMKAPVSVIETASYCRRAVELLTADERDAVVTVIAYDPTAGDLIPGTGGLRKLRIGFDGKGKRGGGASDLPLSQQTCSCVLDCFVCEK